LQDIGFPYATKDVLDCELYILEALEFNLIIYHPYHSVLSYVADCKLEKTEMLNTVWYEFRSFLRVLIFSGV
jgi:hypothetical protein